MSWRRTSVFLIIAAVVTLAAFVAVGDTMSDLEMVVRWNASAEGRSLRGTAVVLCPAEDEPAYRAAGAALFIRSLADLLAVLRESREGSP